MSLADPVYRPMPTEGAARLIRHFARMFRWLFLLVALLTAAVSAMGLIIVWAAAFVEARSPCW